MAACPSRGEANPDHARFCISRLRSTASGRPLRRSGPGMAHRDRRGDGPWKPALRAPPTEGDAVEA